MTRSASATPVFMALSGACMIVVGACFLPWYTEWGPYFNQNIVDRTSSIWALAPLSWAAVTVRRRPTRRQGVTAVVVALLVLAAIWFLSLVGMVFIGSTFRGATTIAPGYGWALANAGVVVLLAAGICRIVQARRAQRLER